MGGSSGKTSNINAFVGPIDTAPNNQFQMGIYTDNNGVPGTLVAQTSTGTLKANSWNTLPISATLQANTPYWLMYNNNASSFELNGVYVSNVSANTAAWAPQAFGSWPSTFLGATVWTGEFSMFVNYTPVVNTTPTPVPPTPTATPTPVPADTQAPSVPANLTAQAVSISQINLAWGASTDNVGVTGYDVYRNGNLIATVASTTFGDNTLTASTTYSYVVKARDAAGNVSGASNTAQATTQSSVVNGSISGIVSSTTGSALCNAKVSTLITSKTRLTTYTNCQGQYLLPNLAPSTYSITYSKTKYVSQTWSVTVTSGSNIIKSVALKHK